MENKNVNVDVIGNTLSRVYNTLCTKAKEYATTDDKLHNFNRGEDITNYNRERILDFFMLKHYISYRDILDNLDKGILPTEEYLEEKVGDLIAYFALFEMSVKDKIKKSEYNTTEMPKECETPTLNDDELNHIRAISLEDLVSGILKEYLKR